MRKEVKIQVSDLGAEGVNENSVGTYIKKETQHYLFYEKQEQETGVVLSQRIVISTNKVELMRRGQQPEHLILAAGERTEHRMELPYGTMELSCDTKYIETTLLPESGSVLLCYDLYLNGDYIEQHKVKIQWKEI